MVNEIETVQVALRIKPLMYEEYIEGSEERLRVVLGEKGVIVVKDNMSFCYNFVFDQNATQREMYETTAQKLLEKLFEGYNVTILAYGQTGSGKTFTMGTNYLGSDGDSTKLGIIPRAVADIFDYIEKNKDKFIFKMKVSFIEIYLEQCYDLLSGKERRLSIVQIRENGNKGVVLPGMTELPVESAMETLKLLERGSMLRVTGSTAMNETSSRSHAVFTIVVAKECRNDKNTATTAKFRLVDLAGSERRKKALPSEERLKEGIKINQGLLALGNVISALGRGSNKTCIGFRDSKLTRVLQDSLGGNSYTLMVACVSPIHYNLNETMSTLRYADRARRIKNKPIINRNPKLAEIARLSKLSMQLDDGNDKPINEDAAAREEKRMSLTEEVQEVNHTLAILLSNKEIVENQLKELEDRVTKLEEERDALIVEKEQTSIKDPSQDEEKMKEEVEKIKRQKIQIIRQMRLEREKFRTWKAKTDKEVRRLQDEERKQATAMEKMECLHAKQLSVLKRKIEEVNKRLKEELDRQEQSMKSSTSSLSRQKNL